jgi:hypothetical protein
MGYATAADLAASHVPLDAAVQAHLVSNCYPPVPTFMVAPAVEAIEAYADHDWDRDVELPEGVAFRDGRTVIEARDVVEALRLDAFVDEYRCEEF